MSFSLLALKSPPLKENLSVEFLCSVIVDELKDFGGISAIETIPYSRDRVFVVGYSAKKEHHFEFELDKPLDSIFLTFRTFGVKNKRYSLTFSPDVDEAQFRLKLQRVSKHLKVSTNLSPVGVA